MDTIVAIATSLASSAGVNIIRVSGNDALRIAKEIFESKKVVDGAMVPNFMYLGRINGKNFTEKAFCVYYKSPFSYTGEDVIEVHCHGGINVTRSIVSLIREKGARPAEAGEFTRRAFLNNKLTLAEAEGVIDMINATSESQMLNAYRLMDGYLTKGIVESERLLIETSALLEAKLDYPEELEEETRPVAYENLKFALNEIEKLLKNTNNVKTVTGGVDVAIVGVPNAGKSSLLNAILQTDRAIVSDIAGTTRDVLKESVEIDGIKLNFLDTAGIREGGDKIENMGIERSKNAIKGADVVLFVKDTTVATNEQEKAISELLDGKKVIEVDN
ncbi:MAG: tRNA uridine-5-carboxymethylaminomethyl(34) synthesis GTPase MnmE, partial [Clostridia bacterium]|nr:tRNA uridine-5-carboxymethylaminomethyl(34) synthesis GTPase MnmE [Clostridia bacterium]